MLYYIVFKRYIYINYMIIRHNIQIQSDFNTICPIILCFKWHVNIMVLCSNKVYNLAFFIFTIWLFGY